MQAQVNIDRDRRGNKIVRINGVQQCRYINYNMLCKYMAKHYPKVTRIIVIGE